MMQTTSYRQRRGQIEAYFDRTAADTWARLTSDAPVSGIRATVRAGRDRMRQTLLGWLPADLHGCRLLDAGCGTGALSVEAARRGAHVAAIDLSPTLIQIARERAPADVKPGLIEFMAGDMLDPSLGRFDFVVAMDSLIHYGAADVLKALAALTARTSTALLFTFAPKTPMLATMHLAGKLFPKSDRSPAIEPVSETSLLKRIAAEPDLSQWQTARTQRIASGFYTSQALELRRR